MLLNSTDYHVCVILQTLTDVATAFCETHILQLQIMYHSSYFLNNHSHKHKN